VRLKAVRGAMQENVIEIDTIPSTVARLRESFDSGRTRPLQFRQQQLAGLALFVREREREIQQALREDLGKPALESSAIEISFIANELAFIRKRLRSWMKPERVPTALIAQPGRSRIYREPLGVVLIIGPWNYPIQLTLAPLMGAIAAGNCTVLKPSELAPATSTLLARFIPQYLDSDSVQVIEGGPTAASALLAERFDHIFYTGGSAVGRIVMEAAARHLTPVTLELGGKSPCIVDEHAEIAVAARRILWGKLLNAGQTCVAPDYVLVHQNVESELLSRMKHTLRDFFGNDPRNSPDLARIINLRHYRRLMDLLSNSGDILIGGNGNEDERYFAPTILYNVPPDSPVMAEEIFGPILPVLRVKNIDEAVAFVNQRPKPLALYLFTKDPKMRTRVLERTSSGAALLNHTCMHAVVPALPFGGVGSSGMGAYHGKATFETFSHKKAVLIKPAGLDIPILYPPYNKTKETWIRRLL
jgi:aldehyde dehydrogenase (NAD+)